MFLRQVLTATFGKNVFTAYKYKDHYLVRRASSSVIWTEFKCFAGVLDALSWFEYGCNEESYKISPEHHDKNDDDELPF